jgi:hypothetical protein
MSLSITIQLSNLIWHTNESGLMRPREAHRCLAPIRTCEVTEFAAKPTKQSKPRFTCILVNILVLSIYDYLETRTFMDVHNNVGDLDTQMDSEAPHENCNLVAARPHPYFTTSMFFF